MVVEMFTIVWGDRKSEGGRDQGLVEMGRPT